MLKHIIQYSIIAIVFFGCSSKEVDEYNKPASYWYQKIVTAAAQLSLEKADGYYASLQSEHAGSPLLPEATLIMAQAHMREGEYLLAEHFLDEYMRRFASSEQREFASYLKIRAKFKALPNPRRDQTLVEEAIEEAESFKKKYKDSFYTPIVDTMLVKLYLARENLNRTIALLYARLDKPQAQKYYENKQREDWIDWDMVNPPETPWYREIYEGDGTDSWYADWLPKSKSIISQDADGNTKETQEEAPTEEKTN